MAIGDNSKVALTLDGILQQTKLSRNEICCKLRELIDISGGGTNTFQGMVKLTSGGTAAFTTATTLQGDTYNSVSVSVISLTTGTVIVTDALGTTNISYAGFSTGWKGLLSDDLTITVTGDAIALVTYTSI